MGDGMKITAHRFHDFSYGHRVVGHEGKCSCLHGHNGRVTFFCEADLDNVGRVIDFGVIKSILCDWIEENWDHRMLLWKEDPLLDALKALDETVVELPCNPTAENMAELLLSVGNYLLRDNKVRLAKVEFMETIKCGATVEE